jgi:hypothetical protein
MTLFVESDPGHGGSYFAGYTAMVIAFSFIFVGVKNFRDKYNPGSISFGKALKIGLGITLVASTIYVIVWLVDYYVFNPDFMDKYAAHMVRQLKESNLSQAVMVKKTAEINSMKEMYKNPVFVVLFTYVEILPVGIVISLLTALILRRSRSQVALAALFSLMTLTSPAQSPTPSPVAPTQNPAPSPVAPAQSPTPRFIKHILTNDFLSEGVAIADVNNDGKPDILCAAVWFEAPGWIKHEIDTPRHYDPATQFSNSFLDFSMDVNQDGWMDLIRISLPGEEAVWYENPKNRPGYWRMHPLLKNAGNESPAFVDIDGDGRPDILCNDPIAKEMIWLKSPVLKGDTVWTRHVIARGNIGTGRYTHGLGFIDMNGDGRRDVVITKGWWECPQDPTAENWVFHPADFGEDCSQIYALDV